MSFLQENIEDYIVEHSQDEPELLQQLNRETWQKVLAPTMLSGSYQGRVLSMISKLIQPEAILEIGTYTGYSALCMAEGLSENGVLHTIDKNEELVSFQRKYFQKSNYSKQINQHLGEALIIIPQLTEKFDLVFIDADKKNYINYYNAIIHKMRKGGVILTDNVLWYGKVIAPTISKDIDTEMIKKYNKMLIEDDRIETIMLPIRDGLTISRVK